jgi:hypothetical protein
MEMHSEFIDWEAYYWEDGSTFQIYYRLNVIFHSRNSKMEKERRKKGRKRRRRIRKSQYF